MNSRLKSEAGSYRFIIRRLEEREKIVWHVEFPDVPGCVSDGKTIGDAIAHGRQALRDCLAVPVRKRNAGFSRRARAQSRGTESPTRPWGAARP